MNVVEKDDDFVEDVCGPDGDDVYEEYKQEEYNLFGEEAHVLSIVW